MQPQIWFWILFVMLMLHGIAVLGFAERLEARKFEVRKTARPEIEFLKILSTSWLFLSGFLYARLPWLWLGLSIVILVFGGAMVAAVSRAQAVGVLPLEPPPAYIAQRARQRRLQILARLPLALLWVWAWWPRL